jgi:hypothetical protein
MNGTDSWWSIHGETLMESLRRAHDGEDPDLIYAELYANSERDEGQD